MKLQLRYINLTLLGLFFYTLSFFYFDRDVALAVNQWHNTQIETISYFFSVIAESRVWLIITVIGFLLVSIDWFKHRKITWSRMIYCLSLSNAITLSLGTVLKILLGRYRPELFLQQQLYGFHFLSFDKTMQASPSGHSMLIVSIMMIADHFFPRYRILYIAIALAVFASRIVLGMHYPSDVLLGAYVGFISAKIALRYISA